MIIDRRIVRNSGATLQPCIFKSGYGVLAQGRKMSLYPPVFVEVRLVPDDGYIMAPEAEASIDDMAKALVKLVGLWGSSTPKHIDTTTRRRHHAVQVAPFTECEGFPVQIKEALLEWYDRTVLLQGKEVAVVHGDPTTENFVADGYWLDPSVRVMPLEAEFDAGKLLTSYCGYAAVPTSMYPPWKRDIKNFLRAQELNIELCIYYMLTHVVRLYGVQPQAREWAVDLVSRLGDVVRELSNEESVVQCK